MTQYLQSKINFIISSCCDDGGGSGGTICGAILFVVTLLPPFTLWNCGLGTLKKKKRNINYNNSHSKQNKHKKPFKYNNSLFLISEKPKKKREIFLGRLPCQSIANPYSLPEILRQKT